MKINRLFSIKSAYLSMMFIVAASNYLVQLPINEWLTYAAFSYPLSYLVTELANALFGPKKARKVVYIGFSLGVLLSSLLSSLQIAAASGTAFLISQLLDIFVFNRFRKVVWWYAPFFASLTASLIDTVLFWGIAFWGADLPILTRATGDFLIKLSMDILMLFPFRLAIRKVARQMNKPLHIRF
jgi:queuosine precursor transporter